MVTQKQNIPALRFPEFKGEWTQSFLGNISSNIGYGMNSAATEFDGEYKYLRITDIDEETRRFIPNPLSSPSDPVDEKYLLNEGDIVFARTGASVGKSYLYKKYDGKLCFAGFLIRFSILKNNAYFVYCYTLKQSYFKWVQLMSMRSGQPGINAEEYKDLKIHLPKEPEQKKIADFLTAVDQKIAQLTEKKSCLEQYKKGVMQRLFTQRLRFHDTNGTPFPDWEEMALGDVANVNMGQSPDSESYNTDKIGVPLIQGNADISNRITAPRNWTTEPTKMCDKGDIILSVRAPVGEVARSIHEACIGRGVCAIRNNKLSIQEFLYQWLLNYELEWRKLEQGSTFTAVSGADIRGVKISIPNKPEQQKIADFLTAIDAKITALGNQLTAALDFKKSLLQKMFV